MPEYSQIVCLGRTFVNSTIQEWYETATGHARKRAEFVRNLGIPVMVEQHGDTPTKIGVMKLSLVTIMGQDEIITAPPHINEV